MDKTVLVYASAYGHPEDTHTHSRRACHTHVPANQPVVPVRPAESPRHSATHPDPTLTGAVHSQGREATKRPEESNGDVGCRQERRQWLKQMGAGPQSKAAALPDPPRAFILPLDRSARRFLALPLRPPALLSRSPLPFLGKPTEQTHYPARAAAAPALAERRRGGRHHGNFAAKEKHRKKSWVMN